MLCTSRGSMCCLPSGLGECPYAALSVECGVPGMRLTMTETRFRVSIRTDWRWRQSAHRKFPMRPTTSRGLYSRHRAVAVTQHSGHRRIGAERVGEARQQCHDHSRGDQTRSGTNVAFQSVDNRREGRRWKPQNIGPQTRNQLRTRQPVTVARTGGTHPPVSSVPAVGRKTAHAIPAQRD